MNDLALNEARKLIAGFIKDRRQSLGRTPEDVAESIGIPIGELRRFEEGRGWIGMKALLKLCHNLDLLFFVEEKEGGSDMADVMRRRWTRPGDRQ